MNTQKSDVILMDGQMPEMDGYKATAEIRQREKDTGAHRCIIAVTAHAMPHDHTICLAAGMDRYIAKPFDGEELLALIAHLPSKARRNAANARSPSG